MFYSAERPGGGGCFRVAPLVERSQALLARNKTCFLDRAPSERAFARFSRRPRLIHVHTQWRELRKTAVSAHRLRSAQRRRGTMGRPRERRAGASGGRHGHARAQRVALDFDGVGRACPAVHGYFSLGPKRRRRAAAAGRRGGTQSRAISQSQKGDRRSKMLASAVHASLMAPWPSTARELADFRPRSRPGGRAMDAGREQSERRPIAVCAGRGV